MKKITIFWIALITLMGIQQAQAQNWLDALKGVATEVIDEATGGKLTEAAIIGKWNYTSPGVRMGSSDTLANLAGAAAESQVEQKLQSSYEKVGIKPGFCSIEFKEDDTFVMGLKEREINGTYTFDPETHTITLQLGKLNIPLKGYGYIDGANFELVFTVDKLMQFVTAIGSKISSLSSLSSMLENYDEVYLGFQFSK